MALTIDLVPEHAVIRIEEARAGAEDRSQRAAGIAAQIDDPAAQPALATLVENAQHLLDDRIVAEPANAQVADRHIGYLACDVLDRLPGHIVAVDGEDAVAAFEATTRGRTVGEDLGDQRRLIVLWSRQQYPDACEARLLASPGFIGRQERGVPVVQAGDHAAQHDPIRVRLLRPRQVLADQRVVCVAKSLPIAFGVAGRRRHELYRHGHHGQTDLVAYLVPQAFSGGANELRFVDGINVR